MRQGSDPVVAGASPAARPWHPLALSRSLSQVPAPIDITAMDLTPTLVQAYTEQYGAGEMMLERRVAGVLRSHARPACLTDWLMGAARPCSLSSRSQKKEGRALCSAAATQPHPTPPDPTLFALPPAGTRYAACRVGSPTACDAGKLRYGTCCGTARGASLDHCPVHGTMC